VDKPVLLRRHMIPDWCGPSGTLMTSRIRTTHKL
jgi:hypothetical protein